MKTFLLMSVLAASALFAGCHSAHKDHDGMACCDKKGCCGPDAACCKRGDKCCTDKTCCTDKAAECCK